jgi:hypothetical protein
MDPLFKPHSLAHRFWAAAFRASSLVLALCLAAIVGFTPTVGYSWVYWVALCAALICAASAGFLRKLRTERSANDADFLLRYRDRDSRPPLDLGADD